MKGKNVFRKAINRFFSSKDFTLTFSKLIEQTTSVKIPDKYEKDLLSKALGPIESPNKIDKEKEHQLKVDKIHKSAIIKNPDFCLSKENYKQFLANDPFGTVESFQYKNTRICIVGACFTHLPPQNIWKLMSTFCPNYVLLQTFPDDIVDSFRLNLKNPKTGNFSNRLYFDQLFSKSNLNFNSKKTGEIIDVIEKELFVDFSEEFKSDFLLQNESNKTRINNFESSDKLTSDVLTTASLFTKFKKIPLVLSDIPDLILRDKICVEMSLNDMKTLFQTLNETMAKNPDFTPDTSLNMTHFEFQELFTFNSDSYTTSLIEYLIHKKNPKRIIVFAGNMQGKSIKTLLLNRTIKTIYDNLQVDEFKPVLFEKPSVEVLCEKYAIYDVMKLGKKIMSQKINNFPQSMALIEKYSGFREGQKEYRFLYYLHQQFVKRYLELFLRQYENGIDQLKLHFYEKIIEAKKENLYKKDKI